MQYKKNIKRGVIVDPEDEYLIHSYLFCVQGGGYLTTKIGGKMVMLHKLICPDYKKVDHKNRNKLDNRRSNLREADSKQNGANRGIFKNNTSGYKGVYLTTEKNWRAIIKVNGETLNLGTFSEKEQAALAYNTAALRYHKEFASINIVVERPTYVS